MVCADNSCEFEAEDFDAVQPGAGSAADHTWQIVSAPAGFSGTASLEALPNAGLNVKDTTDGPALICSINFSSPGTYYVWARVSCASSIDDSVHVGLNGVPVTYGESGFTECTEDGSWSWISSLTSGARVSIYVPSAGAHTFSIWMREDGVIVDKIFLAASSSTSP